MDVLIEIKMHDGTKYGTEYRIMNPEGAELHLDRKVHGSQNQWENVEVTEIEPDGGSLEDSMLFLMKIVLRDTKS